MGAWCEDLRTRLREALEREPDVLVAYLFGSHARGTSGPLSDVDVAVLLSDDADPFKRRLDLIGAVSRIVGDERTDVVVLNEVPVALEFRVLRDGQELVCRDEVARVRHHRDTVIRYIDMTPMRRELERGTRNQVTEGRFGRP